MVVCCAALLVGCGSDDQASPAATGPASSPAASQTFQPAATTPAPAGPAAVGEQQTAGPWGFTVSAVTVEPEAPGQIPPPNGKELMFVEVDLFNSGTGTLQIKPAQFSLTDSAGATVKTFARRQAYNALDMSPLPPNYGTSTAFIYAVDPGSTGFVFTFAPEVDGQTASLKVSIR
jgi:hypothetical protein